MTFIKKSFIAFLFLAIPVFSFGQDETLAVINSIFNNTRNGKIEAIDTKPLYKSENTERVIGQLEVFFADTNAKVRDKAYNLSGSVAKKSANEALRKSVVYKLINGCKDTDHLVSQNCSKALEGFAATDFSDNAKLILADLIETSDRNIGQLAQIAAFVSIKSVEAVLLSKLNENIPAKEKWKIQLALARLGNSESITYILGRVKSIPVNDDMIYEAVPALVYTRRIESFDYLSSIVMSDKKECTSANPDSEEPILCGYRVLEYISPVIKDFPIKTTASGDLQGDYKKALTSARKWLKDKSPNYVLITNTF